MLPVSPETVGRFVKILFGKILGDSSSSETFAVTKHSINRLRTNLRFLFEGLRVSEALYRTRFGDFFFNGSLKRGEITSAPSQTLLEATSLKNSLSLEAVEAIKKTPVEVRTAFSDRKSTRLNSSHT